MALMDADAAGNARAKVESELARFQNALVVVEEARRKAEDEASRVTPRNTPQSFLNIIKVDYKYISKFL